MLIFAVDDGRLALNEAQRAIAEATPEAEIMTFLSASDALDAIKKQGLFRTWYSATLRCPA